MRPRRAWFVGCHIPGHFAKGMVVPVRLLGPDGVPLASDRRRPRAERAARHALSAVVGFGTGARRSAPIRETRQQESFRPWPT